LASTGESTAFLAATPAPAWRRLRQFLLWHLLGAIALALAFGLLGYFAGAAAVNLVERFGAYAALALAALALAAALTYWRVRRRPAPA